MIIGIDPGLTGALAVIRDNGRGVLRVVEVVDLPLLAKNLGKGNAFDPVSFSGLLWELTSRYEPTKVVLEQSQPMGAGKNGRAQGVTSTFSMGDTFGALRAVILINRLPLELVRAASWKRSAGLIGKGKDAALEQARRLHPEAAKWLSRKKDHNRAEAILLARHGFTNGL